MEEAEASPIEVIGGSGQAPLLSRTLLGSLGKHESGVVMKQHPPTCVNVSVIIPWFCGGPSSCRKTHPTLLRSLGASQQQLIV